MTNQVYTKVIQNDLRNWFEALLQMKEQIETQEVYYFYAFFWEPDAVDAATEVLTKWCGWCPQIYGKGESCIN